MSLYGVLRTGVSGMNAQSNRLGTVADNIANSGTVGYKRSDSEFSSLILESGQGQYASGSVVTQVRHAISEQGSLSYTSSGTDLAIEGDGFFVVNDDAGQPYLTRAGSFTLDGASGNLVNAAGYTLMGYDLANGDPNVALNGITNLVPVNVSSMNMRASASSSGAFMANLPSEADIVAVADAPAAGGTAYSEKSSIIVYDEVGNEVTLDLYMTKTAESPATWEYTIFNQANSTDGGFPYTGGNIGTASLEFASDGSLVGPTELDIDLDGQEITLDLTGTTQLATDYTPINVEVDGNAPATLSGITIDGDGTVYANYSNGAMLPTFRIPLADVPSPDGLTSLSGNVFSASPSSGDIRIGFPTEASRGSIVTGALEQSNVDMATELTKMIVAQRDYTANSKVFQTGSELLEILMNLKR